MIGSIVGSMVGLLVLLLGAALSLAGFAFWLWMLINAIKNKGLSDGERIVWVLVISSCRSSDRSFTSLSRELKGIRPQPEPNATSMLL